MKFSCARIFTDHMVVQRNLPIAVFGTAPDGAAVTVSLAGCTQQCVAREGSWLVHLPAMDPRGCFEMVVSCGAETLRFEDVVFGEVWLAGGQSNMEFALADARSASEEIPYATDADLRYYHAVKTPTHSGYDRAEKQVPSGWVTATPQTAPAFSAVGYHFAKRLRASEQVPVGIVGCNWGGTSASCWISREALLTDPALSVYIDEYEKSIAGQTDQQYEKLAAEYEQSIEQHAALMAAVTVDKGDVDAYRAATSDIIYPWPPPMGRGCFLRPFGLYDTMLGQITPYTLRGVIWYQGETDEWHADLYARLFGLTIAQWRSDFGRDDLFFAFVQLTSFASEDENSPRWGHLRAQQALVAETVPNTAMAVIYDVGERDNIHPIDKKTVGNRLADQVLSAVYGQDIDVRLAKPTQKETADGQLTVRLDSELHVSGDKAEGFQICGQDGVYVYADASVLGGAVQLKSQQVPQPVCARYAFTNWTNGNVYQENGIPLPPFEI